MAGSPPNFPPTIIVVHPKERRKKCTVEPLRGREGFVFWNHPARGPQPLESYVRLGLGGPTLSRKDAGRGLLVLDGTWRWAADMEAAFAEVPVCTLPSWKTAYPRVSKLYEDPAAGLATVEAIFAAYHILGRDTAGLLDDYHWANEFLRRNAERL
jgi:pre-rRNA-processing protein TSR3